MPSAFSPSFSLWEDSFMKINHILLISLLIVGALLVPAVSAEEIAEEIYNETYKEVVSDYYQAFFNDNVDPLDNGPRGLVISPVELFRGLNLTKVTGRVGDYPVSSGSNSDICDFTYMGEVIGTGECGYFCYRLDDVNYIEYWVTFDEISLPAVTGKKTINIVPKTKPAKSVLPAVARSQLSHSWSVPYIAFSTESGDIVMQSSKGQKSTVYYTTEWSANLKLIKKKSSTEIVLDSTGPTNIEVKRVSDNSLIYEKSLITLDSTGVLNELFPIITDVYSPSFDRHYITTHYLDGVPPTMRTGTVAMTHVDGTPITGFEVKAVNYYTGEEYTVSTDSDVATITLPMDQTTTGRHTQTGEYAEVPAGYYKFFGYKSGFKMTNEDGIRVTVLPEEYQGSYQLCDILVTTESPGSEKLRTGTITMTDHNGTRISGFEVKAVNYYTGEVYTASTETDVAVITLPMDRTTEIRNPWTGVYEEAPVGYYRFYGQKPGYKMLNEEGIKVSVMPEKYGSYKLCDILVSSDSGPLTGKHQFQLRSRSDNSILQTGTISAKSRTTGIWYNTTVTNGIATLVLPYDTSDALSDYAGHYYVYATSPGYEDSDYGTQIIVSPRTTSEIRTILLTPIGGVPTPGNVTLRIQAISETGQGVPNAEIFIAGVIGPGKDVWDTYTTSWTGFIEVSVPGNSTYDIVARGAGYYDSSRRIEVFTEDPALIEFRLYLSGAPTIEPTTEPTGWVTGPPATQPTGGIPDEDDDSSGFLMEAVRGIGNVFGVGFATAKIIFGMLLALAIGFATAKQLRGGAAEFGLGLLGGTILGVLVGLIPVWTIVVLLLVVGLYIGHRYVGGGNNG